MSYFIYMYMYICICTYLYYLYVYVFIYMYMYISICICIYLYVYIYMYISMYIQAFLHMIILSITSATGQLFIFYTIKEFGPVHFTIIMTSRQILSLVISCFFFGHTLHLVGWLSTLIVFGVVVFRIYVGRFD